MSKHLTKTIQHQFDSLFWLKIWRAIQRILGALVLMGFNRLMDYLFMPLFRKFPTIEYTATTIMLVAFLVIYTLLLVDTVFIFVPRRKVEIER